MANNGSASRTKAAVAGSGTGDGTADGDALRISGSVSAIKS
jgi:hypothetical protein